MKNTILSAIAIISIFSGFLSAAFWFYSSTVKVTREDAGAKRVKNAEQKGERPYLGSVTLDGWDMSATFEAQAKWNSLGAFFAAVAVLLQAVNQILICG